MYILLIICNQIYVISDDNLSKEYFTLAENTSKNDS